MWQRYNSLALARVVQIEQLPVGLEQGSYAEMLSSWPCVCEMALP